MQECSKCKHYNILYRKTINKKTEKETYIPQIYGYCTNKNTNRKFARKTYYCKEFEEISKE